VAAVAIAVPSALYAAHRGPAEVRPPQTGRLALSGAAPGSELLTCGEYSDRAISGGELGAHWKAASVQAGPVWFVYAASGAWRSSQRLPDGRFRDVAGVVLAVRNGSTVEITAPPADRSRFRFLIRATSSGTYTLHDGVSGITLAACPGYPVPRGIPESYAAGLTLFYLPLGYVTDLAGCLSLDVALPPTWHARWTAHVSSGGVCRD
jgi:hypothetical protein